MSDTDNAGTPPADTGGNEPQPEPGAGKTFSQADVDGIVAERLARERKKYANFAEYEKAAKELDELKKGQMSELEKLQAELAEKEAALQARDNELTAMRLNQLKVEKLTAAGLLPSDRWYITGESEEEIVASITELAARLKAEKPNAAQGAGNTGVPGARSDAFPTTRAELAERSKDLAWYKANQERVLAALEKGEIR